MGVNVNFKIWELPELQSIFTGKVFCHLLPGFLKKSKKIVV